MGKPRKVGEVVRNTYAKISVTVFDSEMVFSDLVGLNLRDPRRQLVIGQGYLYHLIYKIDYPNSRLRVTAHSEALNHPGLIGDSLVPIMLL